MTRAQKIGSLFALSIALCAGILVSAAAARRVPDTTGAVAPLVNRSDWISFEIASFSGSQVPVQ